MCFNQIHPLFSPFKLLPYSYPPLFPPNFMCHFFLTHWIYFSDACMYLLTGLCTGPWVASQGPLFWRKLTLPPQAASNRSGISWAPPPSILDVHWLHHVQVSCIQSQAVWVPVCNGAAVASKYCSAADVCALWLLQSFHPQFHNDPWTFKGRNVI